MADHRRSWCARCQYPGLKPFIAGTVIVAGLREESEARPAMEAMLRRILPTMPEILAMIPGALVFEAPNG